MSLRLGAAALLAAASAPASEAGRAGLDFPPGDKRVLVIDTPAPEAEPYRAQAGALLPAWDGLLERDLRIVTRSGAAAFRVLLVGKDGGVKLDSDAPVTPAELFTLIDAMPMRKAELRSRAAASRP